MDKWALDEHARTGIVEAIASHTVIIDVSFATKTAKYPVWGTGFLLKIKNRLFIGTCKHVVKPEYRNEELRVLYRSATAMKTAEKEEIKKYSLNRLSQEASKTLPQRISVIKRFYSDDLDDLVLLELDSSSKGDTEGCHFFPVADIKVPELGMQVYLMGFSFEIIRQVTRQGGFAAFAYFEDSKIVGVDVGAEDFNPQRHFLTDFTINEDSVDPHGLSGCGVWIRLPSGRDNLWTPNLRLVGIQHGYYSKSQVLVATRIERLLKLVG